MINFRIIKESDVDVIERVVLNTGYMSCQLSAASLFCYGETYKTEICFDDGFMFIRQDRYNNGACVYFPPIGTGDLRKAIESLVCSHNNDACFKLWGVTEDILRDIENVMPDAFTFTPERDWAEYIYETKNLTELNGGKNEWKRARYQKFIRNYNFCRESIGEENIEDIMRFHDRWIAMNNASLDHEYAAFLRAVRHFGELKLRGALIRINGEICAYAIGSTINPDVFDGMFQKALTEYKGIYQAMFIELVKGELGGYRYINTEEDIGLEGLRKSKLSYRPDILLMKYTGVLRGRRRG